MSACVWCAPIPLSPVQLLTAFLDSNIPFYNLLSACALFCVKEFVDPFYVWTQNCSQAVPMSDYYPWPQVLNTPIPSWASKRLSSGGNFDPSAVMKSEFPCLPLFLLHPVFAYFPSPHELLTNLP